MKKSLQVGVAKVIIAILMLAVVAVGLGIYRSGAPKRAQEAKLKAEQEEEQRLAKLDEANCSRVAVDAADEKIKELARRFSDASDLARSTSRIALATPVALLQQIERDFAAVVVPKCMENVKLNFVSGMRNHTKVFLAFMQNDSDHHFAASSAEAMANALSELQYIRKCAPRCREKWTGGTETKGVQ